MVLLSGLQRRDQAAFEHARVARDGAGIPDTAEDVEHVLADLRVLREEQPGDDHRLPLSFMNYPEMERPWLTASIEAVTGTTVGGAAVDPRAPTLSYATPAPAPARARRLPRVHTAPPRSRRRKWMPPWRTRESRQSPFRREWRGHLQPGDK